MAIPNREARMKKIMERGPDRLALITGQIQALPSLTSSDSPSSEQALISPLSISLDQIALSPNDEGKGSCSILPKHDPISESDLISISNGKTTVEPHLNKFENIREPLGGSTAQVINREHRSGVQIPKPNFTLIQNFNPSQIIYAIRVTENIRIACSVVMAVLVVLSQARFPVLRGNLVKSFILSMPLVLVLITNATIVIARLYLEMPKSSDRNEVGAQVGIGWAEQLGKTLEMSMVVKKVMDSVSMDCGVYAVIVICGFSLACTPT